MYEAHWQISARPFDPQFASDFYYPSEVHQAALLKLRYTVEHRRAVGLLCGPSGMGKSFILNQLRNQLPDFVGKLLVIPFPAMTSLDLLQYLAGQFSSNTPSTSPMSMATAIQTIEQGLVELLDKNQHTVLMIDDAEWLDSQGALSTLRLLLNLAAHQAQSEAALTILLSGQPNLLGQLDRHPALDQRVSVRCLLQRFSIEETTAYIQHRLRQVGRPSESIFDSGALEAIHRLSEGVPRRINAMADLALMVGYAQEQSIIRAELIENVHRELAPTA